jgi:enamine deaminase RidA (YjgF/YER057c/UK114 family)
MDEYLASRAQLGGIWRARLGYHYPAMAVVGVTRLVHPAAKVEIQGLALLEEER